MTIETKFGTVEITPSMFDIDGTNLEEGVEVRIDDNLELELYGFHVYNFEDMTVTEIEDLLIKNNVV